MIAVSHSFILGETKMEKIVNELAEIKAEISKLAKREKLKGLIKDVNSK